MSRVFSLFFITLLLPHGWLPHKAFFPPRRMNLARYAYYSIGCGRGQGQFAEKRLPRGGSCQRPRPLTDEGKPCRRLPVYGAMAATSPSSGLGHLPQGGRQKPADFLRQSPQFRPGQGLSAVNRASSSCTRGILCTGMPMRASSFFVNGSFFAVRPSRDTASRSCPNQLCHSASLLWFSSL